VDKSAVNATRLRYSILQFAEATAVVAVALAVGRAVAADYVSFRHAAATFVCFAPPVLPQLLTGGICGAYLGIRWFWNHHLLWSTLESALIGVAATIASLVSLVTNDLPAIPPNFLLHPSYLLHVVCGLFTLGVWGGALSGFLSLVLLGLRKLINFS